MSKLGKKKPGQSPGFGDHPAQSYTVTAFPRKIFDR